MTYRLARAITAVIAVGVLTAGVTVSSAQAPRAKRVLLLTHNLFLNHDHLQDIEEVLPQWGRTEGFAVSSLEGYKQTVSCTLQKPCGPDAVDLSMVTTKYLSPFDGIVMVTNGELPFTDEGKQALLDFVRKDGKGIVFIHQATNTLLSWKGWGELVGGYSAGGALDNFAQRKHVVVMKVEDRKHPATRSLPDPWALYDEFYQFPTTVGGLGVTKHPIPVAFSRANVHVLVSVDSGKTDFMGAKGWEQGGDYPLVWYKNIGKGRTFYSNIGHRPDLWRADPVFQQFITGAIRWALELEK